jgi:hypothetical protein
MIILAQFRTLMEKLNSLPEGYSILSPLPFHTPHKPTIPSTDLEGGHSFKSYKKS